MVTTVAQCTHDPVQFVHFKALDNLISLSNKNSTIIKSKVTQGEKLFAYEDLLEVTRTKLKPKDFIIDS